MATTIESLTSACRATKTQIGEFTYVLHDLLSPTECEEVIGFAEDAGFSRHRGGSRDQFHFKSAALAADLAARLQVLVPTALVSKSGGADASCEWHFSAVDDVFTVTRYALSDGLAPHFDGVKFLGPQMCSAFTLTIYLNSVPAEHGGDTLFDNSGSINKMYVDSLQPAIGSALLLDHGVLHAGSQLSQGTKYILRTSVLYSSAKSCGDEVDGVGDLFDFELSWPSTADPTVGASKYSTAGDHDDAIRYSLSQASVVEEQRVQISPPQGASCEAVESFNQTVGKT